MPAPPELAGCPAAILEPILGCASGDLPANVALARAAVAAPDRAALEDALARAADALAGAGRPEEAARLRAAQALWNEAPDAWTTLRAVLDAAGRQQAAAAAEDAIARWSDRFDRAVQISPEAGVALYSLGRADLLEAATREIVAYMDERGLLGEERIGLEIGCGIGRLLRRLAPMLRLVIGIDVSPRMLAEARLRCDGISGISLLRSSGRDLAACRDAGADLIYSVDAFPYLVDACVAASHVQEAHRVLKPGGTLLILNYSYRGDLEADRAELAGAEGFQVVENGTAPFRHWDGRAFRLERLA